MYFDLSPLLRNANYRHLFFGQLVSFFGSMISLTVIPLQVYHLTGSSSMVGLISAVELVPLLIGAFLGGVLADYFDRRKLLINCELLMVIGVLILTLNSVLAHPSLWLIFAVAGIMASVNGFHRPAMDSLGQALLSKEEIGPAAHLNAFKFGLAILLAPSLGGVLYANWGAQFAYLIDLGTFTFSVFMLWKLEIRYLKREKQALQLGTSLKEGFKYAMSRQELLGTYLIDMTAMALAFPVALFPSMSQARGRPDQVGLFYLALSMGALLTPLFSGVTRRIRNQGRAIIYCAAFWGIGIICFGWAQNFWLALVFLAFAGLADTLSGVFRNIIWNQTIPNQMRGRMAGIEMISYMSGPLLGNARAGWMAEATSNQFSLTFGGISCVVAILLTAYFLPRFRRYVYSDPEPDPLLQGP